MSSIKDYRLLQYDEVLKRYPPVPSDSSHTKSIASQRPYLPVLVVLDDDPTGTQTCHDINVLTVSDHETLLKEFRSSPSGFFILTNSRALPTAEARQLITTICRAVKDAAAAAGQEIEIVLRGDSTLRGHFPDEPEVVEEVLGQHDAWILAPFFEQGGRLTIDDVHYVRGPEGELTPAAQTPFAKDASFGYCNSNLRRYIVEKSNGRITDDRICSVSIADIRNGGAQKVCENLMSAPPHAVVIVNAIATSDMEVFLLGLLEARMRGKRFLYRTGAAFVSTRLAIEEIPPLSPSSLAMDISPRAPGGLILAGSYVPKTTAQLQALTDGRKDVLETICLEVKDLLDASTARAAVLEAADRAGEAILASRDVLVMTSRELITGKDGNSSLRIGQAVADALVLFLRLLIPRPRYIIAKGGITSSDAASKGLRMRRAEICGQAASGVPLWRCDEKSSKYPGVPFVVFPGNVGQDGTLRDLVERWSIPEKSTQPEMQYQNLGSTGLKVSRVILGCMGFGNPNWQGSPWVLPDSESLPLLKRAYDTGLNTWETADTYSNGHSELIIGKAMKQYDIPRSKVVIISKIYHPVLEDTPDLRSQPAANDGPLANQMGLSRKRIFEAVEGSLRRLQTPYLDVLMLHKLDVETPVEEIMRALHDLVVAGKVHYLGASNLRCWQLAKMQFTAKMHGWTPFSCISPLWNLLYREEERELVPFCRSEGIAILPWSPLARGLLGRPYHKQTARSQVDAKTKQWFKGEQDEAVVGKLEALAERKGRSMAAVATAWLLHQGSCPILGLATDSRIENVREAFAVEFEPGEVRELEDAYGSVQMIEM
ncbi:uncharacterized protein LTR77_002396 [Saxophila tyrrhenica]|uniref:NADP-dependent oxidoreductase domain-containing protein n=1 Tax=Saxophila tyrrhenica TaxID=1690608 RepID=A0AAV9PLW4_9PEZI|nr:hypothetical protein LTR77_002396 [Saxophila tyrrhenica]